MGFIRSEVAPRLTSGESSKKTFSGLLDALFLLNWVFVPGSPSPTCIESADTDGNGKIEGLVDSIFVLGCQFVSNSPCPSDPFLGCGSDPDPANSLGCDEFPGCP